MNQINKQNFVSIIIPCYNGEETIAKTIDAIMDQTYSKECYELIIVDNMSKDQTAKIIQEKSVFYSGRVRYILEIQKGVSHARNTGIKNAKGDFFLFTDDDCLAHRNWVSQMVAALEKFQAGALQGRIILGTAVPKELNLPDFFVRQRMAEVDHGENSMIMDQQDFVAANMAFTRETYCKVGGFNPDKNFYLCEDTELTVRMRQKEIKCVYVADAVVEHHYSVNRLKLQNFLKQSYQWGKANVILEPVDMSKWRYIPYCLKKIIFSSLSFLKFKLKKNSTETLLALCRVCSNWGRVVGTLRRKRSV